MISLNSTNSASEYLCTGAPGSCACESSTDLVNSGSYFFTDLVVVFGITTFVGLGGSFFTIGFTVGFTETKDFAPSFFFVVACSFATGLLAVATFFATGFFTVIFFTGFFTAPFPDTCFAGFFAIVLFTAFFAGLALPTAWTGFLVAGFPPFGRAGFLVGILLPFF